MSGEVVKGQDAGRQRSTATYSSVAETALCGKPGQAKAPAPLLLTRFGRRKAFPVLHLPPATDVRWRVQPDAAWSKET